MFYFEICLEDHDFNTCVYVFQALGASYEAIRILALWNSERPSQCYGSQAWSEAPQPKVLTGKKACYTNSICMISVKPLLHYIALFFKVMTINIFAFICCLNVMSNVGY